MTKKEHKEYKEQKEQKEKIEGGDKNEDVVFEEIQEEKSSFKTKKNKKKEDLEKCLEERKEYLDGWQRARAEMVNLKKQHLDEKKLFTSIGKEKMLEELIPILDNFNAAFSSKSWEEVDQNWRTGIEYIYKQFLQVLENNGIEEFGSLDDEVDFEKYEVIEEVENSGEKSGKILQLVQKGYKNNNKVLRPAKVRVAK